VTAAAAIVLVALVADDPAVLRNAPRDDAPAQATLWRGDWLEVRGETACFLRVYDHRHERPGYIRPMIVRVHRLEAASISLVSVPAGAARKASAAYPIPSDSPPFASRKNRTTAVNSCVLAGSSRCTRTMVGRM